MKTIITLFILALSLRGFCQDYSVLEDIKMVEGDDFVNNESKVLECANFILSVPIDEEDNNKIYCAQFMLKWMQGTEYIFTFDAEFLNLIKGHKNLSTVYVASMIKGALTEDVKPSDSDKISERGINIYLDFCENPHNNVKLNKSIKKALKKRKK